MANDLSDSGTHPLVLAPAVDYPLAPARLLRGFLLLLWGLVVAVDVYWLFVAPAGDWRPWVGLLVSVGAAALAWRCGPLTHTGTVAWDGGQWWWTQAAEPVPGQLAVRLDIQSGLLLRFVAESGAARWLWLDQATSPAQWLALRRAVFAVPGGHKVPASLPAAGAAIP
jgi:hypothetical protein